MGEELSLQTGLNCAQRWENRGRDGNGCGSNSGRSQSKGMGEVDFAAGAWKGTRGPRQTRQFAERLRAWMWAVPWVTQCKPLGTALSQSERFECDDAMTAI